MSEIDARLISGERVVFTTRRHWAGVITASWWPIGMLLLSFALAWIQPDSSSGVLGFFNRSIEVIRLGLFLGACGWIAYNIVAWRTAEYTVTNRRILGQEGLLRRRSTDTLLTSVSDIQCVVPALGAMLGFGNIRVLTAAGGVGRDTFTAMNGAQEFKQQVLEQKAGTGAAAQAAGLPDAGASPVPGAPAGLATPSYVAQEVTQILGHLANLRAAGVITAEEYEAMREEWLRRI